MTMTPEDASTWRDIADELTQEQVQELAGAEPVEGQDRAGHELVLLWDARAYARANLLDALIGPVPAPAGAAVVGVWQGDVGEMPYRFIRGARRPITDEIDVSSCACQFADGSIDDGRSEAPSVYVGGYQVPVDRARAMISALQECLDEVDGWAGR